ncbi:hypothetical protein [Thermovibrio sp.]
MKVAVPIEEDRGLESRIALGFKGAPYFVILSLQKEGVSVSLYENPSSSDSELAQVLLSYGVKKVVYPKVREITKSAFKELGLEVLDRPFKTLKEVIYFLF